MDLGIVAGALRCCGAVRHAAHEDASTATRSEEEILGLGKRLSTPGNWVMLDRVAEDEEERPP